MAKQILINQLEIFNERLQFKEKKSESHELDLKYIYQNKNIIDDQINKFQALVILKQQQAEKNNIKPIQVDKVDHHIGRSKSKNDINRNNNQTLNKSQNKSVTKLTNKTIENAKSIEKNKSTTKLKDKEQSTNRNVKNNTTNNSLNLVTNDKNDKNKFSNLSRNVSNKKIISNNVTAASSNNIKSTIVPQNKKAPTVRQKTPAKKDFTSIKESKDDAKSTVTTASSKARITSLKENLKPNKESIIIVPDKIKNDEIQKSVISDGKTTEPEPIKTETTQISNAISSEKIEKIEPKEINSIKKIQEDEYVSISTKFIKLIKRSITSIKPESFLHITDFLLVNERKQICSLSKVTFQIIEKHLKFSYLELYNQQLEIWVQKKQQIIEVTFFIRNIKIF